jgi:hypothetical protein
MTCWAEKEVAPQLSKANVRPAPALDKSPQASGSAQKRFQTSETSVASRKALAQLSGPKHAPEVSTWQTVISGFVCHQSAAPSRMNAKMSAGIARPGAMAAAAVLLADVLVGDQHRQHECDSTPA